MKYLIVRLEVLDDEWIDSKMVTVDRVVFTYPQVFSNLKEAVKKFRYLHRNRIGPAYNDIIRSGKKFYINNTCAVRNDARVFSNIWIYNNIEM